MATTSSQSGKHTLFSCRSAGILLHPTSLPCTESYWQADASGFGSLGKEAYHFIDFMKAANLKVWQVLPLGPTSDNLSPYQSYSVHAGNPDLINLDELAERGWISSTELILDEKTRYGLKILRRKCAESFFNFLNQAKNTDIKNQFNEFCKQQSYWLDDFALFSALHDHFNQAPWVEWPEEFRWRQTAPLEAIKKDLANELNIYRFEQFAFAMQWNALKTYAREKDILIFGDMPIFVGHDSADVWAQPHYFKLDKNGYPTVVSGTPPDSFSDKGQCWGNPIYNWEVMQKDGFQWWLARFRSQSAFLDLIRVDHFCGFESYWEIPGDSQDARQGKWVKAPGDALLSACLNNYPDLMLIAENLGTVTDDMEALRKKFHLPGMLVLQFAFENDADNPHLPHRHCSSEIIYTGTHDNNTTLGWYKGLTDAGRQQLVNYTYDSSIGMPWLLIDMAFASSCNLAIIPMQDFLELDENSRMNIPGTSEQNWLWKFSWDQIKPHLAQSICDNLRKYHRSANR